METISIVKLIKIVKINGCAFENKHTHMVYKYIYNIYMYIKKMFTIVKNKLIFNKF